MPTMTIDSTALPSVLSAGMRPARNQIAVVTSMLLPLVSRVMSHWPRPVTSPAPEQHGDMEQGTGFSRSLEQRRRVGDAPGEFLHDLEQPGESRRAKAGAEARQNDGDPETDRARVAQRRGNVRSRRRAGARGGGLCSRFQCSPPPQGRAGSRAAPVQTPSAHGGDRQGDGGPVESVAQI